MTLEELNLLIPAAKVYRLTADARYLILVDESVTMAATDELGQALAMLNIPAAIVAVQDVARSVRVFKMEPTASPAGELRPLEGKREPNVPSSIPGRDWQRR